jgi:hypothetical protein
MHYNVPNKIVPLSLNYGNFQGRQENKVRVHSISNSNLSPVWSCTEQLLEDFGKNIQEASQKEANHSESSHTRDNSVEPPTPSATIEVQVPTYVASILVEEELIVQHKQQVLEDTQLDEMEKIGTMVFSPAKEETVSFATLHPSIDFVILDIVMDVMVPKALLLSVFPKVVPTFKQASSAQILTLPHFKTHGRVFSNQRSMMHHNLLHIFFLDFYFEF